MNCIGGDVSKGVVVFFSQGQVHHVPNNRKALRRFLKAQGLGSLVVESTGRYHLLAAQLAFELGLTVYVVNPREFSHYRRSVEFRIKSDATDAELLARFGEKERDRLVPWLPPSPRHALALAYLRLRAVLVKSRTAIALSLGDMKHPASEKAIAELTAAIEDAQERLVTLVCEEPGYQRPLKIPGVGALTAAAMVLAFAKGPFGSSDAFVAFLGLDLRFCDSGIKIGKRRLSKRGDPLCRCLLYTAALAAARTAAWKALYERYLARGFAKTQALVIIARKIARTVWSMLHYQTTFAPARLLALDKQP